MNENKIMMTPFEVENDFDGNEDDPFEAEIKRKLEMEQKLKDIKMLETQI